MTERTPPSQPRIQYWVERLQAVDDRARDELLTCACGRLTHLTRKMLRGFPGVHRWEDTADVLQNASLRLWEALRVVHPESAAHFFRLAAVNIRRELIDLARYYQGPQGPGAHHASHSPKDPPSESTPPGPDPGDTTHEPSSVAMWAEFHRLVEALPAEDAETFDLVWYQGLSQAEAAQLLGVSERTFRRRWRSARLKIMQALGAEFPC